MIVLIIAMAVMVIFNIIVLLYKLRRKQYVNLLLDILILISITKVLGGSTLALLIGNVASFAISILLFFIPLKEIFTFNNPLVKEEPIVNNLGYKVVTGRRAF